MAIKATRDGHIKLPTKVASPPLLGGGGACWRGVLAKGKHKQFTTSWKNEAEGTCKASHSTSGEWECETSN